ncbi:F-type H+-transporting ATPase subunit delta [Kineosphaera limosa]|uniref:ATP synthase subunit delta n=1 Tax=Kineosphaera limosa NBRC 100340 TaxID=1184609 RepID=K6VNG1_9MICO|nr:F0F1 ATP synthase subunit delta [Kineosphaera limosa]NYD99597.1 F-type H+-transporting ATPase subunit delta [Kineosphaera limosa]GAB97763.1 ATP synthase subunit delta [Kineosphaera limosa NBRC 100340]
MLGVSRAAHDQVRAALATALDSGVDWSVLSEELFSVVALLDSSSMLRRALADPSRSPQGKKALVERLLTDKASPATVALVGEAVAQRWSDEQDLTATLDQAAVETQVAIAQASGSADELEEQLFRFERAVAGNPDLRDAIGDPRLPVERKLDLVQRLLADKANPQTVRLARQAVAAPRGKRFAQAIDHYLDVAAKRREQLSAVVTVATALSTQQHDRLEAALSRIYSKPVTLKMVIDPEVLGGIRVQVGDEVVDGTIVRRLDEVRRLLGS